MLDDKLLIEYEEHVALQKQIAKSVLVNIEDAFAGVLKHVAIYKNDPTKMYEQIFYSAMAELKKALKEWR